MWANDKGPIGISVGLGIGVGCTEIRSGDGSESKSEIKSSTCNSIPVPVPVPDSLQLPTLKDNKNIDNFTHPFKLKTTTTTTTSNRTNYRRSTSTSSCTVDVAVAVAVEEVCDFCRSDTTGTDEAGSAAAAESELSQNLAVPESIHHIQSRPRPLCVCWSDKFTPSETDSLITNSELKNNCKKSDKFKVKNYQRGYFYQEVNQRIDVFKVVSCAKTKMSLIGVCVSLVLFLVLFAGVYCLPPRDQRNNEIIAVDVDSNSNANSKIVSLANPDRHGPWNTLDGSPTVLFAHRGEKVLLPEHSLPGYETASILGADYVEPDLCLTKDNVFVCHHDLFLRDGTDVRDHPEFEHMKKLMPDGTYNWYIRDFTLKQLKTLRLIQQKTGIRPQDFNLVFTIPTFQEYLNTIHEMTYKLNKTIGIVPELKNPTFHNSNETEPYFMEKQLLEVLSFNGYPINEIEQGGHCQATIDTDTQSHHRIKCPPVIIQCFEKPSLDYLKDQTEIDLLMLIEIPPLLTYKGMAEVGKVAKYYSPWKEYLYVGSAVEFAFNNVTWNQTEIDLMGGFIPADQISLEAHKHGMKVVIWTIHDSREPSTRGCAIVPGCEKENKTEELNYFFNLGVDGIFIENVAESSQIRRNYEMESEMRFKYDQLLKSSGSGGEAYGVKGGNLLTVISCLLWLAMRYTFSEMRN